MVGALIARAGAQGAGIGGCLVGSLVGTGSVLVVGYRLVLVQASRAQALVGTGSQWCPIAHHYA